MLPIKLPLKKTTYIKIGLSVWLRCHRQTLPYAQIPQTFNTLIFGSEIKNNVVSDTIRKPNAIFVSVTNINESTLPICMTY